MEVGEFGNLGAWAFDVPMIVASAQASQNLLRRSADQAMDLGRRQKTKPRDLSQDLDVSLGHANGWRAVIAFEALLPHAVW